MKRRMSDMSKGAITDYLKLLAKATDAVMPDGAKFALLVFDDPSAAQYVSNCDRDSMISALRECADRLEKRQGDHLKTGYRHFD